MVEYKVLVPRNFGPQNKIENYNALANKIVPVRASLQWLKAVTSKEYFENSRLIKRLSRRESIREPPFENPRHEV